MKRRLKKRVKRLLLGQRLGAENVAWVFGSERTGSTWLGRMMSEVPGHAWWNEPLIGFLFGEFHTRMGPYHEHDRADDFIFGANHRASWTRSVANFVLEEANARYPESRFVVIKEPNGSIGAPLLSRAMPESRMILLVRDPRDAVASSLASHQKNGWLYKKVGEEARSTWGADENPDTFVEGRANFYAANVGSAKEAYATHPGPKTILRYEDLRSDTLASMRRLYAETKVPVEESVLVRAVEKHAWENIPEGQKGEGAFNRKGEVGSWREDLTPEQARIVERITKPLLERFYPG
ncbi:MAG: sulfotransferase domain-containing protein [Actinomycetota bacterium]|jgi:hypothetical protein|nr:sulfotransferase domain-containing protein [Actinomycetota bacterium]